MTCVLTVEPDERTAFAYLLLAEVGKQSHGTKEHQEVARGLASIYEGFIAAPEGPVEVETLNDEMYALGVHNHADASELEEYWLDNKAALRHGDEPAPFAEEHIGAAIQAHFPEVVHEPSAWTFTMVQPIFSDLGFKIDRAFTEGAPRGRQLYNKERAEIIRRTRQMQESRAGDRGRRYPRGVEIEAWRRAFREGDIGPGEMREVTLDDIRIVVANIDGTFYAIEGKCTHAPELSALRGLAAGELDAARACVTCPWHGAQFDVRTGAVLRQPYSPEFNREHRVGSGLPALIDLRRTAKAVRPFEVKVDEGYVWVNVV